MMPLKQGKILAPSLSNKASGKNNNALLAGLGLAWAPAFANESYLSSITLIQGRPACPDGDALPLSIRGQEPQSAFPCMRLVGTVATKSRNGI